MINLIGYDLNPDKPPLRLPPCWSLAPKSHGGLPHLWDPTRKIDLPFRDLDIPPYDDIRDIFKHVGNNRLGRVYRVYWDWDYNLLKYFPSWSVWSRPTPEILENYLGITANSPYDIREDHYHWWVRNFDRKVLKISPYTHNTNFPTTVQDVIRGDVLKYGTNEVLPPTAYELWEAGVYCTWKKDSNGNWVHTTPVETLCDWEKPQPNGKKSRPIYSDPIFYRSKNLGSINSGSGNSGSGNSRSGNSGSGNSGSGNSGSGNSGSGNSGSGNSGSGNYRSGKYKIPKIGEKYPGSWVPVYGPSRGVRGTTPEGDEWDPDFRKRRREELKEEEEARKRRKTDKRHDINHIIKCSINSDTFKVWGIVLSIVVVVGVAALTLIYSYPVLLWEEFQCSV